MKFPKIKLQFPKKIKPVHCLIIVLMFLILSCATFCPHSCVFLPSILNFREDFEDPAVNKDEKQKAVFAMFYAPWCGYCKKTKPEWDRVAKENPNLMTAIDCTDGNAKVYGSKLSKEKALSGKEMAEGHKITSYPTIRFFKNGLEDVKNYVEYTGERTADSFREFVKNNF